MSQQIARINQQVTLYLVYIVVCTSHAKFSNGQCVRLYKNSTCNEGIVQVEQNGTWSFINGSDLDYTDVCVLCRNLGGNVKHVNCSCTILYCILGHKGVDVWMSLFLFKKNITM